MLDLPTYVGLENQTAPAHASATLPSSHGTRTHFVSPLNHTVFSGRSCCQGFIESSGLSSTSCTSMTMNVLYALLPRGDVTF